MSDPRRSVIRKRNGTSARNKNPVLVTEDEIEKNMQETVKAEPEINKVETENQIDSVKSEPDTEKLQLQDKLLRLQAEFDNYRKRQARDFRKMCNQGKKDLIKELVAVLDNYHRAEKLVKEGNHSVEEIADGLMKTSEQLIRILRQEGLKELDVKMDDTFDPNIHEAMLAEDKDGLEEDTVLEVFQKGYSLDEDLLRPARVKVGKPIRKFRNTEHADGEGGE